MLFSYKPIRTAQPVFALGAVENPRIGSRLHATIAYVSGVMTSLAQAFGYNRRKGIIDEKFQDAERSGNSRSRTASAA